MIETSMKGILRDEGSDPQFHTGEKVAISVRFPIGHYRVPHYVRGKRGVVKAVVMPAVNNEEEGFGRNAGLTRHYYRVAISLTELWPGYSGSPNDALNIDVYETWLERI